MRQATCITSSVGTAAFWTGMALAANSYPSEYDWRYMTISNLVYAERNPLGFSWARAGMALCGIAGLYWTIWLAADGRQRGAGESRLAIWVVAVGYLCMTLCALLPEGLRWLPRGHDTLALAAFLGLCLGMGPLAFNTLARDERLAKLSGKPVYAWMLAVLTVCPVIAAAATQVYVKRTFPDLPWVGLVWRARRVSLYLSFAFWEWVACAMLSLYMVVLSCGFGWPPGRIRRARQLD